MSELPVSNRKALEEARRNYELVKEMGADWYDPIPTEQYTCFEDPEFTITPRGHRMLATIRSHTIKPKKGGRTPAAMRDGKHLKCRQIGALLDWDEDSARKVLKELIEHGLVREDEKGWLWLCGKVRYKSNPNPGEQPPLDEDQEWHKFCTDFFPAYLAKQFQQLSKSERPSLHQDIKAWNEFENKAKAAAMAAVREEVQNRRDRYYAERYRVKVRRFERKAEAPKPKPIVQLALLWEPELSVQNSNGNSVHRTNGSLYNVENDSVQTRINKEDRYFRKTETVSGADAAPSSPSQTFSPPPTPLTEKPSQVGSRPDTEPVVAIVESAFHKLGTKDPLRAKYTELPTTLGMPVACTCEFVKEKIAEGRAKTAGALHGFLIEDVNAWKRSHAAEIESARAQERFEWSRRGAPPPEQSFEPSNFNGQLKSLAAKKGMA